MIIPLSIYRLGRLMQEFHAKVLVNQSVVIHEIVALERLLNNAPRTVTVEHKPGEPIVIPTQPSAPIPANSRSTWKSSLEKIMAEVIKLQLEASHATVVRMQESLDDPECPMSFLAGQAEELHGRIVDGLNYRTCFALWGESERLYQAKLLFGPEVATSFARASVDIEEAGKCLAVARGTAAVFHLMRVLEVGLQALAADLGITKLERNWQQLLQDVDAKIKALPFKTDDEKSKLAQRSAAVAHLRNVKDAWRNDVMHPRDVYTVEQATDIFNHTKALMRSLATFLTWPVP